MSTCAECAETLQTVVVDEAALTKVLRSLRNRFLQGFESLLVVQSLLVRGVAITQGQQELVAKQLAELQSVLLVLKAANFPAACGLGHANDLLLPDPGYRDLLHRNTSPVFRASELEVRDLGLELGRHKEQHFHRILVLLVQCKVQVLSSKVVPLNLALLLCAISVLCAISATSVALVALWCCADADSTGLVLHGERLELRLEDFAHGDMGLCSLGLVGYDLGLYSIVVARLTVR